MTAPGDRTRLSREDYARAEALLPWNAARLMSGMEREVHWTGRGEELWYQSADGDFLLVDAASGAGSAAFDHARIAAALAAATERPLDPARLPVEEIARTREGLEVTLRIDGTAWTVDAGAAECRRDPVALLPGGAAVSPDGQWAVFAREHQLVLRSCASGEEWRITVDGSPERAYATPIPSPLVSAGIPGRAGDEPAAALWSPDSSRLLTYRIDRAGARELAWVQSVPTMGSLRPTLHTTEYPLPGDEMVPEAELLVLDLKSRRLLPLADLRLPLLHYGSPVSRERIWWSPQGDRIFVVTRGRGFQSYALVMADPGSGATHTVLEERAETGIDPGPTHGSPPLIRVLDRCRSVLWYSQRDGWGHLYLHDLETGQLVRQVTAGEWSVTGLSHVDQERGEVFFTAVGRERGRDPYYVHLYRAGLDGTEVHLLTPEDATHSIRSAPSGGAFADRFSTLEQPPRTLVRDPQGQVLVDLGQAGAEGLVGAGWRPAERFRVKARDGVTDVYGALFLPSRFGPEQGGRLPVVDDIYAGPQTNHAPTAFAGGPSPGYWHAQAIAELGFAVVMIDGLGMPLRSKAFGDRSFRDLGDGGIPDHVAGIRQLAQGRPYLDLDRVGVYGHSAGGYASAHAILCFPDFYKVAVSSAGNHDHRLDKASWVERYMGLPVGPHYAEQANPALAAQLRGRLLLIHGEMDENVHPASTLRLAGALIEQGRDFDLLLLPNRSHRLADDPYFVRRRWDYLVRHLLGAEPPSGYAIEPPPD